MIDMVVDSSVWIDYFTANQKPQSDLLDYHLEHSRIIVGDIILLEVLRGVRTDAAMKTIQGKLSSLPWVPFLTPALAISAAEHYRTLRALGITVPKTADLIIGTWCIVYRMPLLHADNDFLPMETHLGLRAVAR